MKTIAIILAAGTGTRFGGNVPKQFLKINGKEILAYSLDTFSKCEKIDEIVLVINENFIEDYHKIMNQHLYKKNYHCIIQQCMIYISFVFQNKYKYKIFKMYFNSID